MPGAPARAQRALWLDATLSTAQPPAGIAGATAAAYVLLGLRAENETPRWNVNGTASVGSGFENEDGRWLWLDASAARAWQRGHTTLSFAATGNGLNYTTPFRYGAYTLQLLPSAAFSFGPASLSLAPQVTAGGWSSDGESGAIVVAGSSIALTHTSGPLTVQLKGDAFHADNGALDGTYAGGAFDVSTQSQAVTLGAGVRSWHTPSGQEWGYSAYLARMLASSLQLNAQLARSVTDAVLATPASFGASLGLSWRVGAKSRATVPVAVPVAAVAGRASNGRKVRFTLEYAAASTVSLSGSFSDWKPIPMRRSGKAFVVDVVVPSGSHQYGFLINDTDWYLPPGAGGIVDDDFGRRNATLVVDE